ncbi:hypothetical protein [Leptolyngbya sp. BC1307]|uniref:hypothetical protein n=1 Tax=Leptolyngbya sp. BC1307 TaxID=2029589 RepID=UPI000EFD2E8F|nr:hypothetical protein [Leptolyngbya sp. BC1307]
MKINSKLLYSFAVGALSLVLAQGAYAQRQSGLVNVNLTDVDVAIAEDINVNVSQIPVTVQVPIGIAANVCNVAANVLAADIQNVGGAECDAETTSQALNQVVQRQMGTQR